MKLGLISDVHATVGPLREALTIFRRARVDAILCAGDIAGYGDELEQTVELLTAARCRAVLGNHDLWRLQETAGGQAGAVETYLAALPVTLELSAAGTSVYMVHASPPDQLMEGIRLLDEHGALVAAQQAFWSERLREFPCDLLVVGHTHQLFVERLGPVLVVNPGSSRFNHTCVVVSFPSMTVDIHALGGGPPVLAWNWGMEGGGRGELRWRQDR